MSAGDPGDGDFDDDLMEMDHQHEGGDQDRMDTEKECLKEEEHSNTNPLTPETGESVIQESTDEEAEKLQRELAMECKQETSSTKEPVTQNDGEDYGEEKDKDELEPNSDKGCDSSNYKSDAKMEDSLGMGSRKNPMLLSPIIRCVLKFLDFEDIKNCRLVCREWGSIGKIELPRVALIRFRKNEIAEESERRLTVDFQSCFLESAFNFTAFKISGFLKMESVSNSWTVEELTNFFDQHRKHIKELTLHFRFPEEKVVKKIDFGSWISKSPMVQKDAKHMTKLSIEGVDNILDIRPLHLIAHIKDLSLSSNCRIHFEAGVKICSIKLKLDSATFYQDAVKLYRVRMNDIVDLGKTKELSLRSWGSTKYVLDLNGSASFEKVILECDGVEYENGETSDWEIEHLAMTDIPYSLNNQMNIKELYLNSFEPIDLFTLPTSIQNLALSNINNLSKLLCSQPMVLKNLQYLQIVKSYTDFSFLSLFMNCPKLTHLKFNECNNLKMQSLWMPKTIKTLTLQGCHYKIEWLDGRYWNLETLVTDHFTSAQELCETKIRVQNFIINCNFSYYDLKVGKTLVGFLELRQRLAFGKRLFIGELKWKDKQLEETVLKEHVEVKSSFYVFQGGQKGSALSRKEFHELIPKHLDIRSYTNI